jgi:hypothetical protein
VCYDEQQKLKQSIKQSLEKEYYRMQTLYRKNPTKLSSQTRKIAIGTILLFALSGLISGFAVGAFVRLRPATDTTHNTGSGTVPVVQITKTPATPATPENVNLDEPVINPGDINFNQIANGSTTYTFSALIIEKNQKPIQASDVTCKLWVTKGATDVNSILGANNYAIPRAFDNLQQPFPNEVNALNFISPTQTQFCIPNGNTTWKYTISPSVDPGTYNFVVLADWKGKHYNWRWIEVQIKKAG